VLEGVGTLREVLVVVERGSKFVARDLVLPLVIAAGAAVVLAADYMSTPFDAVFDAEEAGSGVPGTLLRALARKESSFRPTAVSPPNTNGSVDWGLMQVNERTARALGFEVSKLLDPRYNVHVAAAVLLQLRRELGTSYSPQTWIAAYNAGAPAILKRGVFNLAYTSEVHWHWQLYQLAQLVKGLGGGGK